jgi:NAD(P)-dependent dehydrogenase (short-subunit alcohol dehydrogenase family)
MAIAGNTPYHAAKWAVGGFSDALAMEVGAPKKPKSER